MSLAPLRLAARSDTACSGKKTNLGPHSRDCRLRANRVRRAQLRGLATSARGVGISGVCGDTGGNSGPVGSGDCGPGGICGVPGPVGSGRAGGAGDGGTTSGSPIGCVGGLTGAVGSGDVGGAGCGGTTSGSLTGCVGGSPSVMLARDGLKLVMVVSSHLQRNAMKDHIGRQNDVYAVRCDFVHGHTDRTRAPHTR